MELGSTLYFQVELGESLTARTEALCKSSPTPMGISTLMLRDIATFRELGPPDLCHVVKSNGRSGQRDVRARYL